MDSSIINSKCHNLHLSSTFELDESSFTKPWETSSNKIESRLICSFVSFVNLMLGLDSACVSESWTSKKVNTSHNILETPKTV